MPSALLAYDSQTLPIKRILSKEKESASKHWSAPRKSFGHVSPWDAVHHTEGTPAGEAIQAQVPVAVCSTSNERAVSTIVRVLLGPKVESKMRVFAGDVVEKKKPSPDIYNLAALELKVDPSRYGMPCLPADQLAAAVIMMHMMF